MITSLLGNYTGLGKRTTEEMSLGSFPKTVKWRRRHDFYGRVFHSQEAATGKALSPLV